MRDDWSVFEFRDCISSDTRTCHAHVTLMSRDTAVCSELDIDRILMLDTYVTTAVDGCFDK
eukprot:28029-Amorphochlora_amoeboformis.AAC.1